jgi:hypothetical protein
VPAILHRISTKFANNIKNLQKKISQKFTCRCRNVSCEQTDIWRSCQSLFAIILQNHIIKAFNKPSIKFKLQVNSNYSTFGNSLCTYKSYKNERTVYRLYTYVLKCTIYVHRLRGCTATRKLTNVSLYNINVNLIFT